METDLTRLSPAALDAWLGECERQADHSISGRTIAALLRYVRTMNGAFERQLTEAGTLRKERAALAARVAELEGVLLGMQQKCEGEYPKYHNDGAVPAWESMTMDIKHALDGGKETTNG